MKQKPRIAHIAGSNATIANSAALVTSNKARAEHGLPVMRDESGKPMHSWRVLILPFLDAEPLYKQYDFSEPWDGPKNSLLLPRMVGHQRAFSMLSDTAVATMVQPYMPEVTSCPFTRPTSP